MKTTSWTGPFTLSLCYFLVCRCLTVKLIKLSNGLLIIRTNEIIKIKSELIILSSTLIHFRGQGLKGGLIKNDVIVLFTKRGRCREYFRETKWRSVETNGRRDSEVGRLPQQKQLFFNTVSSLHQRKLSAKSLFSPGIMDSLSETFISRLGLRREFTFYFCSSAAPSLSQTQTFDFIYLIFNSC